MEANGCFALILPAQHPETCLSTEYWFIPCMQATVSPRV